MAIVYDVNKYLEIIAELNQEINRLEGENERLISCLGVANKYQNMYFDCLQEIKEIAERLLEKGLEPQSVEHQLRLRGKEELAQIILQLIEKTEVTK